VIQRAFSWDPRAPRIASWVVRSRPYRDWIVFVEPTQHCVLGYTQPSLSGLVPCYFHQAWSVPPAPPCFQAEPSTSNPQKLNMTTKDVLLYPIIIPRDLPKSKPPEDSRC
jgi:hypothetical protein